MKSSWTGTCQFPVSFRYLSSPFLSHLKTSLFLKKQREREKERTGSIQMAFKGAEPIPEETTSNSLLTNTRCCFCFPCFSSRRSSTVGLSFWERIQSSSQSHGYDPHQNQWWFKGIRALKKIREWSEIVAGPKWKTFIRRFNRTKSSGSGSGRRHGNFQYDPLSYSLNFDEGPGGQKGDFDELDDYGGFRDFSSRYASVSASGQPVAMDASESKDVVVMAWERGGAVGIVRAQMMLICAGLCRITIECLLT